MNHIEKDCLHCQNKFSADPKEVKRGNAKFCSRSCSSKHAAAQRPKPEPNVECAWCQKKFYRNESGKTLSKSGLFFCTRACKDRAQALDGLEQLHLPHFGSGIHCYRDIAFRTKPKQGERCNYNANEAAIIVHHKDRNRDNNNISNLEVLCCNCHAIEHYDPQTLLAACQTF